MTPNIPFFITSRSLLLRMRNVWDKCCRRNQNTHFVFSIFFFFENHAAPEIMWKNIVERGRPQITIWRMRIACCITKATDTHSKYLIRIAFALQQWLQERARILRLYVHWLSCTPCLSIQRRQKYVNCRFAQSEGVCEPAELTVSVVLTLTLLSSVIRAFLSFHRRLLKYHSYYLRPAASSVCFNLLAPEFYI